MIIQHYIDRDEVYSPQKVATFLKDNAQRRTLYPAALAGIGTPTPAPNINNVWGYGFAYLPTLTPTPTVTAMPAATPTPTPANPPPLTNLVLRLDSSYPDRLILDYSRSTWSGSTSHRYQFTLHRWQASNNAWVHHRTTSDGVPPAYFDSLTTGEYYAVEGFRCHGSDCGEQSNWSDYILLPDPPATATPTATPTSAPTGLTAPTNLRAIVNGRSVTISWTRGRNAARHAVIIFTPDYDIERINGDAGAGPITFTNLAAGSYVVVVTALDEDFEMEITYTTITIR